jgi:L-asparaginase / beta-aspartyl-peptidase
MSDRGRWALAVHGGAKEISTGQHAHRTGCLTALTAGGEVLERGGTAIDAVEAAVRVFEDDPTFNAGQGSVANAEGAVEMDAGLMDGRDLRVGAVAGLRSVRHPISVARALLPERSVLLAGTGAYRFACHIGAELLDSSAHRVRTKIQVGTGCDTVGCVALDVHGSIAAGNSTGGLEGKQPGRVGDSPLPGCGLYADDAIGGVALSGEGEAIIRMMLAGRIMHAIDLAGPQHAVAAAIIALARVKGEAGAIAIDPRGRFGWAHNSRHFVVGFAANGSSSRVYLAKSEERDG